MKRETIAALCIFFPLLIMLTCYSLFLANFENDSKVILQCKRKYKIHRRPAIDIRSKKEVRLIIPKFTKIKYFRFIQVSKETYRVEVETFDSIPIETKDNLIFTLFFRQVPFIGVTCGVGPSPYRSPAPSRFGCLQGGVYSTHLGRSKWIAPLKSAMIKENKLTFDFSSKFIQNSEEILRIAKFAIRYSPHGFDMKLSLVDGVDFECPDNEGIIYMTCSEVAPPP